MKNKTLFILSLLLLCCMPAMVSQAQVPSPTDVFGFQPGADYKLADYDQMLDYYKQLDEASERVQMVEIGESSMGRPMLLLFISTEENLQQLDKWRTISEKLSRARIDDEEARKLSKEGKAVVWIDGGMHATELAHGQMTSELAYMMATEETDEMQDIRENVITLLMPVMNPDGLDIVASWYEKNIGTPYETSSPPWLYQKYVGHDNNRDWFMNNMVETQNVTQKLYREWYPQIVFNHHQTSPSWTKIFIPPFSDPVNPKIHPAVTAGVNEVGSAMAERFSLEAMPGAIADNRYTMFWNGGGRTVPYYHNQIGILTETGHRTPTPRFYDPDSLPKLVGSGIPTDGTDIFYPDPWKGGESHFRDAVDYMLTATMATLDLASDRSEKYLYNIYRMGRDAIDSGNSDSPYAYVVPTEQWDYWEATNLVNVLWRGGIEVKKATDDFAVSGNTYSKGSYIIYAGQAFRPYLMDLLEKQEYPTRLQYPGGPPDTPYDLSGWTLPMQMGVTVDRIEESFDAKTEDIKELIEVESGSLNGSAEYGFAFSGKSNASVKAANILMSEGASISKTMESFGQADYELPAGSFVATDGDAALIEDLGLTLYSLSEEPEISMNSISLPRVGLYKSWDANMDEGWTRWLLEEYAFQVDTLHDADIRGKDLSQYHSIIIPSQRPSEILHGHSIREMPEEYTGGIGLEGTLSLKKYTEQGGTLLAFDAASDFLIEQLGLPLKNVVSGLADEEFFIPGSLIKSTVNIENPLAFGMQDTVAVSFNRSRAFEIERQSRHGEGGFEEIADAPKAPVDVIATYADSDLLMSGWAMGEDKYLSGKPSMVRVTYGSGQAILFGFRPQFRGQPRGTYKLVFNSLYGGTMEEFPYPRLTERELEFDTDQRQITSTTN